MLNKSKLSKGILEMKFMKRTKDKVEKEILNQEGRDMYAKEISEKMIHGSNYIIEPSFVLCEGLVNGHISCRGMNPELERLIELEEAEKLIKQETKMEEDITDQEMVVFYENIKQTISNKFKKPKKRTRAYYEGEENGKITKTKNTDDANYN